MVTHPRSPCVLFGKSIVTFRFAWSKPRARCRTKPFSRSLARKRLSPRQLARAAFPRSSERGLIEARGEYVGHEYMLVFPRSSERGLIEASRCGSIDGETAPFPRSSERGLIEAP